VDLLNVASHKRKPTWAVLRDNMLFFFKSGSVGKPTEVFLIDSNAEPLPESTVKHPFAFTVAGQTMAASGEVEMWAWINKMNSCIPWYQTKRTDDGLPPGLSAVVATPLRRKNVFLRIFSTDESNGSHSPSPQHSPGYRKTMQLSSSHASPDIISPVTPLTRTSPSGSGECPSALHVADSAAVSSSLKVESHMEGKIFGAPIVRIVSDDPAEGDANLPAILDVLVRDIRARGLKEEGILRVPGSHSEIEAIRKVFEVSSHARDVDLKSYDVLSVGGAMKAWLREIPHSFLTCDQSHQQQIVEWTQAHQTIDESNADEFRSMLESSMPPSHVAVLRLLSQLVLDITAHEELNKMTTDNVLTCLLPSMKIPAVIFIRLVQNLNIVFPSSSSSSSS